MKFQRIPVLALATLLVTAGACGGREVLETKGASKVASASDHFGSADAFEQRLNSAVNGPKHLGSADAIERRVTEAAASLADAKAIAAMTPEELAATFGNVYKAKTLPRPDVLAAQVQQSIQAKAYVDALSHMSPAELAAAFGYYTPGTVTP
jgi:hypothetical protein